MGEDSENEEADVEEEEEEAEVFTPIDVSAMPDGEVTCVLGQWSTAASIEDALNNVAELKSSVLIVNEGTYGALELNESHEGLVICGSGAAENTVFASVAVTVQTACIKNVSFVTTSTTDASAVISCQNAKCCKVVFTHCRFSGGKNSVEVHAFARPTFVSCSVVCEQVCGVYCFPRSHPQFSASCVLLDRAGLMAGKLATDKCLVNIARGETVVLLGYEAAEEDGGVPWCRVAYHGAVPVLSAAAASAASSAQNAQQVVNRYYEGLIRKPLLDYTHMARCTIAGKTADTTDATSKEEKNAQDAQGMAVGVFSDNGSCIVRDTLVEGVQTGFYMKDTCKDSIVENVEVSNVTGTGVYLDEGCRAVVKNSAVRDCSHYALLVSSGPEPASDEVTQLCQMYEECRASCDTVGLQQLTNLFSDRGIQLSENDRQWTDSVSRTTGTWRPAATRAIIRNCVLESAVRIGEGTSSSFFGNVVVKPATIDSRQPFKVNGITLVSEAPKKAVLKRDDEEADA